MTAGTEPAGVFSEPADGGVSKIAMLGVTAEGVDDLCGARVSDSVDEAELDVDGNAAAVDVGAVLVGMTSGAVVGKVELFCPELSAPPELLIVTCGPVVVVCVVPVGEVVSVVPVSELPSEDVPVPDVVPDTVDNGGVDTDEPVVASPLPVVPVDDEPSDDEPLDEVPLDEPPSAPVPAHATPGVIVLTAVPIPSATANAPTRPT